MREKESREEDEHDEARNEIHEDLCCETSFSCFKRSQFLRIIIVLVLFVGFVLAMSPYEDVTKELS